MSGMREKSMGNKESKIWRQAYLGLGANRESPILKCYQAIYLLHQSLSIRVMERSSFYQTEPFGYEKQNWFINLVVKIRTNFTPRELLHKTQEIEKALGKNKKFTWGSRAIDIDILLYDNEQILEADLHIPHPLLHARNFVLRPLAQIAPNLQHPGLSRTMKELFSACRDRKEVRNIEYVC